MVYFSLQQFFSSQGLGSPSMLPMSFVLAITETPDPGALFDMAQDVVEHIHMMLPVFHRRFLASFRPDQAQPRSRNSNVTWRLARPTQWRASTGGNFASA